MSIPDDLRHEVIEFARRLTPYAPRKAEKLMAAARASSPVLGKHLLYAWTAAADNGAMDDEEQRKNLARTLVRLEERLGPYTGRRGGPNPGGGRPPEGDAAKVTKSFSLDPEVAERAAGAAVGLGVSQSAWVEQAIREKLG